MIATLLDWVAGRPSIDPRVGETWVLGHTGQHVVITDVYLDWVGAWHVDCAFRGNAVPFQLAYAHSARASHGAWRRAVRVYKLELVSRAALDTLG